MTTVMCPKCGEMVLWDVITEYPTCVKHGEFPVMDSIGFPYPTVDVVAVNRRFLAELSNDSEESA